MILFSFLKLRIHKHITAAVLIAAVVITLSQTVCLPEAYAVGPVGGIMRIGLNYGSTAVTAANLQNETGSGYDFGYYNSSREFVYLYYTDLTRISMMRDVNMYYDADANSYKKGTGDTSIGCFHIQFSNAHATAELALEAGAEIPEMFLKYMSDGFHVCSGDYATQADAAAVLEERAWEQFAVVTSGTKQTICVAGTGSGDVLFEFDCGGSPKLAVKPRGTNTITWFKGYKYPGAFEYSRPTNEDLTIINYVNIDDYVKGVLPYEMGKSWPIEALKAQALCARTYAATKVGTHSSSGFDLCTEEHCQMYRGYSGASELTNQAADETAGMYITYKGALCETYYSSSDGGATESIENVWGSTRAYLIGVIDPYESDVASKIADYRWTVSYAPEELTTRLKSKGYTSGTIVSAAVSKTSATGNAITVTLIDKDGKTFTISKGDKLRSAFGVTSIRFATGGADPLSSAAGTAETLSIDAYYVRSAGGVTAIDGTPYAIAADGVPVPLDGNIYATNGSVSEVLSAQSQAQPAGAVAGSSDGMVDGKFVFKGAGRGHNVGMSQWGAYSMALNYKLTAGQIIKFYFT